MAASARARSGNPRRRDGGGVDGPPQVSDLDWRAVARWMAESASMHYDLEHQEAPLNKKMFIAVQEELLLHSGTTIRNFCGVPPASFSAAASVSGAGASTHDVLPRGHNPAATARTLGGGGALGSPSRTVVFRHESPRPQHAQQHNYHKQLYLCIDLVAAQQWVPPAPQDGAAAKKSRGSPGQREFSSQLPFQHQQQQQPSAASFTPGGGGNPHAETFSDFSRARAMTSPAQYAGGDTASSMSVAARTRTLSAGRSNNSNINNNSGASNSSALEESKVILLTDSLSLAAGSLAQSHGYILRFTRTPEADREGQVVDAMSVSTAVLTTVMRHPKQLFEHLLSTLFNCHLPVALAGCSTEAAIAQHANENSGMSHAHGGASGEDRVVVTALDLSNNTQQMRQKVIQASAEFAEMLQTCEHALASSESRLTPPPNWCVDIGRFRPADLTGHVTLEEVTSLELVISRWSVELEAVISDGASIPSAPPPPGHAVRSPLLQSIDWQRQQLRIISLLHKMDSADGFVGVRHVARLALRTVGPGLSDGVTRALARLDDIMSRAQAAAHHAADAASRLRTVAQQAAPIFAEDATIQDASACISSVVNALCVFPLSAPTTTRDHVSTLFASLSRRLVDICRSELGPEATYRGGLVFTREPVDEALAHIAQALALRDQYLKAFRDSLFRIKLSRAQASASALAAASSSVAALSGSMRVPMRPTMIDETTGRAVPGQQRARGKGTIGGAGSSSPAVQALMASQQAGNQQQQHAILDLTEEPVMAEFTTTMDLLERGGEMLRRVQTVHGLARACNNAAMQERFQIVTSNQLARADPFEKDGRIYAVACAELEAAIRVVATGAEAVLRSVGLRVAKPAVGSEIHTTLIIDAVTQLRNIRTAAVEAKLPSVAAVADEVFVSHVVAALANNVLCTRLVYEAHKSDPPQERCTPRTTSAILWVRRLYRRLERAIQACCTSHWAETALRTAPAKQVIREYNACASALIVYEQEWLAGWLRGVDAAVTGLRASLFVKNEPKMDPDEARLRAAQAQDRAKKSAALAAQHHHGHQTGHGGSSAAAVAAAAAVNAAVVAAAADEIQHFVVNFDPGVLQLFSEARVLVLIGVKLPEAAYSTLVRCRAESLRSREYAKELLALFREAESSIEPVLAPLFSLHRERAASAIHVGMSQMTWSSMNLHVYLRDTLQLLSRWVLLAKRVTNDFRHRVIRSLEMIAETRWVICGHDATPQQYGKDGRPIKGAMAPIIQSSVSLDGNSSSSPFLFPTIVSLLNAQLDFATAAAKRINVRSTEIASALRCIVRVVIEDAAADGIGKLSDLQQWVSPFAEKLFIDMERYVLNATVSAMQSSVDSLCKAWQIEKVRRSAAAAAAAAVAGGSDTDDDEDGAGSGSSGGEAAKRNEAVAASVLSSASLQPKPQEILCPMFLPIQVRFMPPNRSGRHGAEAVRNRVTKFSIVSLEPSPQEIQRALLRVARIMLESTQLIYAWAPDGAVSSNLLVDVAHVQQALQYLQKVADLAGTTTAASSPAGASSSSSSSSVAAGAAATSSSSSAAAAAAAAAAEGGGPGQKLTMLQQTDPDEDELLEEAALRDETAELGINSAVDTWDLLQYTRRAAAERNDRKLRFLKDRYPVIGKDRAITTAFLQLVGMFAPFGREIDAILTPVAGASVNTMGSIREHQLLLLQQTELQQSGASVFSSSPRPRLLSASGPTTMAMAMGTMMSSSPGGGSVSPSSTSHKLQVSPVPGPWAASFCDREASVAQFGASIPAPTYSEYDVRMRAVTMYAHDISTTMPDIHRIGCIAIDLRPLKASLKQECQQWLEAYGRSLCAATRRELEGIIHRLEDFRQRMSRPLLELSDVMVVANSVSAFRSEEESIDARTAPVQAGYDVLQAFRIKVPLEDLNVADALYLTLANVKEIARTAHDQLRQAAPSFRSALVTYIQSFEESIGTFVKEYRANGPHTVGTEPRMATQRMKHFSKQYYDRARRLEQVRMGEQVFGLTATAYDAFSTVGKELELQARLYDLYSEVLSAVQVCEPMSWITCPVESLESSMAAFRERLMALPRALREFEAFVELKALLTNILSVLPFIPRLRQQCVRSRHWDTISRLRPPQTLVFESSGVTNLRLSHFFDAGLSHCAAELDDLLYGAQKEAELEGKLRRVSNDFVKRQIVLAPHRSRENMILKPDSTAALLVNVEEAQALLVTLMSSRFNGSVRKEIADWMTRLSAVSRRLEDWLDIQRTWAHLESVFLGSSDIAKEMPLDVKRFLAVDRQWERMMRLAADQPLVVPLCAPGETVANSLPTLRAALEASQKSLSSYVHTKRVAYPRFFFISDSELLDILGRSSDTISVVPHLRSLFNNVQSLEFAPVKPTRGSAAQNAFGSAQQQQQQDKNAASSANSNALRSPPAIAFVSCEKERIPFVKPVPSAGNDVVKFLQLLLDATHAAMKLQVRYIREEIPAFVEQMAGGYIEPGVVDRVLYKTPAQVLLVLLQLVWTTLCESVLLEGKSTAAHSATRGAKALLEYLVRIVRHSSKLSACDRVKVDSAITIHLHNVDNMMSSLHRILRTGRGITDFEWLRQMRTNWHTDKEELVMALAEVELPYEYEYIGSVERLVVTDLTDRIYLSCTQAISMGLGAAPAGPAGTGKTETTRDLARACGRYFLVTNCSSGMSAESVGRIVHGTAQSGCWFAFDEVNRIEVGVLSAVAAQIASVFGAKREGKKRFVFTNGNTVTLDKNCAIFVTMNPTYVGRTALPENLKALFRSVAVVVPDTSAIVRVRLASSGFTEGNVLAKKLTLLYEMCAAQLSQAGNYDFGLRSILSVLRAAGPALRSELEIVAGKANFDHVLLEHSTLVRVIRSINTSKLLDTDAVLFRKLLADTFSNVAAASSSSVGGGGGSKDTAAASAAAAAAADGSGGGEQKQTAGAELHQMRIEQVADQRGLYFRRGPPAAPSATTVSAAGMLSLPVSPTVAGAAGAGGRATMDAAAKQHQHLLMLQQQQQQQAATQGLDFLIDRCMMLHDQWQVRHGLCVVGATATGKTQACNVVAQVVASDSTPRLQRCNPKAVEASRLFGAFDPRTTDWAEGVLVELWRRAARKSDEWSGIVFDGPVDANWVEDLNSVLDDTKVLTLANGERLPLGPKMRILIETDSLQHASPATVSRLGLVYFSHNAADRWQCLVHTWVRNAPARYSRVPANFVEGIANALLCNMGPAFDIVQRNWAGVSGGDDALTSTSGGAASISSCCAPVVFAQAVLRYVDAVLADLLPGVVATLTTDGLGRSDGGAVAGFALYWGGASLQPASCHTREWGVAFGEARKIVTRVAAAAAAASVSGRNEGESDKQQQQLKLGKQDKSAAGATTTTTSAAAAVVAAAPGSSRSGGSAGGGGGSMGSPTRSWRKGGSVDIAAANALQDVGPSFSYGIDGLMLNLPPLVSNNSSSEVPLEALVYSLEKRTWMPWRRCFPSTHTTLSSSDDVDPASNSNSNNNAATTSAASSSSKPSPMSLIPLPRRFVVADDSSIRAGYWIEHLRRCQTPVLITGGTGCGKSQLARHVLGARVGAVDGSAVVVKEISLSFATTAVSLQRALLGSAERNTAIGAAGTVTTCTVLLDDLHLPARTAWGDQPSSEVLRQVLEDGGFFCSPNAAASGGGGGGGGGSSSGGGGGSGGSATKTTQEWTTIPEIHQFCATVASLSGGGGGSSSSGSQQPFPDGVPPRLSRHFAHWRMGDLGSGAAEKILFVLLYDAIHGTSSSSAAAAASLLMMMKASSTSLAASQNNSGISILNALSKAAYDVCAAASERFRNTSLPETVQYHFSMKDMIRFVDGVAQAVRDANGTRFGEEQLTRLLAHELRRTLCDKLARPMDLRWLNARVAERIDPEKDIPNDMWACIPDADAADPRSKNNTNNSGSGSSGSDDNQNARVKKDSAGGAGLLTDGSPPDYFPMSSLQTQRAVEKLLQEYNDSHPGATMDFALTEFFVTNIVRVARVLRIPRGHLTLLGVGGSGKVSLVQVACLLCGHRLIRLRGSSSSSSSSSSASASASDTASTDVLDEVREALRMGTAGRTVTFVVSDNEPMDNGLLELVSNLLSDGELPYVFTKDELEALREEMYAKMDSPPNVSPAELFVNVIRARIHVACCFSPSVESGLRQRVRNFPSLVTSTTVIWVPAWPAAALQETAKMLLSRAANTAERAAATTTTSVSFRTHNLEALARICSSIHITAFEQAHVCRTQQRKCVYITPKMFLDYMDVLVFVAGKLKREVETAKNTVDTGIARMIQVQEGVTVMRRELQEKQVHLLRAKQVASDLLVDLEAKTTVAERSKKKVEAERNIIRQRTKEIDAERDEAEIDMLATVPAVRAATEALSTINPEDISNVRSYKEPPLMVRRVMDGVLILLHSPLDSPANVPLVDPSDGRMHITPSWGSARKEMQNAGFLKVLLEYPRDRVNAEQIELVMPYLWQSDYTKERAKSACGSLAGLCTWVRAMAEYYAIAQAMIPKQRRVKQLEATLVQSQKDLKKAERLLAEEESALGASMKIHEDAVENLTALEQDAARTTNRLATAEALLAGLGSENRRWRLQSTEHNDHFRRVEGDAVLAAAFAAYCAPFDLQTRTSLIQTWRRLIEEAAAAERSKPGQHHQHGGLQQSYDIPPYKSLTSSGDIDQWHTMGLPQDELSEQNAVLCNFNGVASWMQKRPLLIDPDGQGATWAEERSMDRFGPNARIDQLTSFQLQPVHVSLSSKNFPHTLEDAVRRGRFIMVHDVEADTSTLVSHLRPVLSASSLRRCFDAEKGLWYKVAVLNGKEIVVHDTFSIVLCTRSASAVLPPEMFALVQVCEYSVTALGLEEQLLGITVRHERGDIERNKTDVRHQITQLNARLRELEASLLTRLGATLTELLDDSQIVEVFADLREQAAVTQRSLESARETERILDMTREAYRSIARKASRVCLCVKRMKTRNIMYSTSLSSFIRLFELSLRSSKSASDAAAGTAGGGGASGVIAPGGAGTAIDKRKHGISKTLARLALARFGIGLFNADKTAFILDLAICFDEAAAAAQTTSANLAKLAAASCMASSASAAEDFAGDAGDAAGSASGAGSGRGRKNRNTASASAAAATTRRAASATKVQNRGDDDETATADAAAAVPGGPALPGWIPSSARPGLRTLLAHPQCVTLYRIAELIVKSPSTGESERQRWVWWLEADPEPESGLPVTFTVHNNNNNKESLSPLEFLVLLRLLRPDRVSAGATQYCARILGETTASLATSATDFRDLSNACSNDPHKHPAGASAAAPGAASGGGKDGAFVSASSPHAHVNPHNVDLRFYRSSSSIAGLCANAESSGGGGSSHGASEGAPVSALAAGIAAASSSSLPSSSSSARSDGIVPVLCILAQGTDPTGSIALAAKSHKAILKVVSLGAGQEGAARRAVQALVDRDKPDEPLIGGGGGGAGGAASQHSSGLSLSASASGGGASAPEMRPDWVLLQNAHLSIAFCFDVVDILRHEEAAGLVTSTAGLTSGAAAAGSSTSTITATTTTTTTAGDKTKPGSAAAAAAKKKEEKSTLQQQQQQAPAAQFSSQHHAPRRMLWITAAPHEIFPAGLLQRALHVTDEPPHGVRAGLLRAFRGFNADQFDVVETNIYRRLLYVVSFMHATLIARRRYGVIGWSQTYEFTPQDLNAAAWYVSSHLLSEGEADWSALRYMLGAVHLGGRVMDSLDRRTITALCDKWLRPELLHANAVAESSSVVPGEEDDPSRTFHITAPARMKDLYYLVPPTFNAGTCSGNPGDNTNNSSSNNNFEKGASAAAAAAASSSDPQSGNNSNPAPPPPQTLAAMMRMPPVPGEGYPLLQSVSGSGWAALIREWVPSASDPPSLCGLFPGAEAARGSSEGQQLLAHVAASSLNFFVEALEHQNAASAIVRSNEARASSNTTASASAAAAAAAAAAKDASAASGKGDAQSNAAVDACKEILAALEEHKVALARPEVRIAVELAAMEAPLGPALQQEYRHAVNALNSVLDTSHAVIASASGQAPLTAELVAASESLSAMRPLPQWLTFVASSDRLGTWVRSFKRRLLQILGWASNTLPRNCFWLGGMQFPRCWIACVRQDLARREGVPLDSISLVADVSTSLTTAQSSSSAAAAAAAMAAVAGGLSSGEQHHGGNYVQNEGSAVNSLLEQGMYRVSGVTLEGAIANSAADFTGLASLAAPPGRQFRTALPHIWLGASKISGLGETPEVDVVTTLYQRRRGRGAGSRHTRGTDTDAISSAVSSKNVFWCPMYHNSRRGANRLLLEVPFRTNPEDPSNSNEAWALASAALVCALEDE